MLYLAGLLAWWDWIGLDWIGTYYSLLCSRVGCGVGVWGVLFGGWLGYGTGTGTGSVK
ncbi:hypothetical protein BZA05DRAFT_391530 [Tricharina praecox]|uniref:uncharacterized protein n=1 Tax=Tricharina praecox TaxID=43433 RepID=UPI002220CEE1|nr:uncharacterized protein BZA05DRAFT_391530 [Tricharina praecox]KAI5855428.1 hypothetical protein BZA05DRAFT_391530 [Tricharina praecox]